MPAHVLGGKHHGEVQRDPRVEEDAVCALQEEAEVFCVGPLEGDGELGGGVQGVCEGEGVDCIGVEVRTDGGGSHP